ncbi:S-adenosyl-L-methionine-dependent methyltransferase [Rhypophila decipiens]
MGAQEGPSLTELSATITDNVRILDTFFAEQGLPRLSSAIDAPTRFPVDPGEHTEIHHARRQAMDAAKKVHDLLWGPQDHLLAQFTPFLQLVPLHFLRRFNILPLIPLDGSISYPDLATASKTHEPHLRRLLRLSIAVGFLAETKVTAPPSHEAHVRHNISSSLLLLNPYYMDILGFMTEYVSKSAMGIMDAMEQDPLLSKPNNAGFNSAFGGVQEPFLKWIHNDEQQQQKEAARVFRGTMEGMVRGNKGLGHEHIVKGWRWDELVRLNPREKVKVVDVGGSSGHTCIALAKAFPTLEFVVQDFTGAFDSTSEEVVKDRIQFMEHDFFSPQPKIPGARVYLLRWILHDWPPETCRSIVRNLVMGMQPGASILVAEVIMPPRGVLAWPEELFIVGQDIIMMALHNSQERTLQEYKELVTSADERLKYVGCSQPEGSVLSFIEFQFDKEQLIV